VARLLSQVVAILLLSATVVAGAGAMHALSVAASPAPVAGCHHGRAPSNPSPADYRCCGSGHRSALLNRVFSSRPALQAVGAACVTPPVAVATFRSPFPPAFHSSGGPPSVSILRI
jgi:hypothetical protein